jgi:hypothetical protein
MNSWTTFIEHHCFAKTKPDTAGIQGDLSLHGSACGYKEITRLIATWYQRL